MRETSMGAARRKSRGRSATRHASAGWTAPRLDVVDKVWVRSAHQEAQVGPQFPGAPLKGDNRFVGVDGVRHGVVPIALDCTVGRRLRERKRGFKALQRTGQGHAFLEKLGQALSRIADARFLSCSAAVTGTRERQAVEEHARAVGDSRERPGHFFGLLRGRSRQQPLSVAYEIFNPVGTERTAEVLRRDVLQLVCLVDDEGRAERESPRRTSLCLTAASAQSRW